MESAASTHLRPAAAPTPISADHYRVLLPQSSSLIGALVGALLEGLSPGVAVIPVEYSDRGLRATDVLIERAVTGRKMVVCGTAPTRDLVAAYLQSGVDSLVGIDASRAELLAAIESLNGGPPYVSSAIVQSLIVAPPQRRSGLDQLTQRELEVFELVVDGLSNREVAERLCLSPNTVRSHLQSVSSKLGVSSRMKLAAVGRTISD